jgi:hypothetical protein
MSQDGAHIMKLRLKNPLLCRVIHSLKRHLLFPYPPKTLTYAQKGRITESVPPGAGRRRAPSLTTCDAEPKLW